MLPSNIMAFAFVFLFAFVFSLVFVVFAECCVPHLILLSDIVGGSSHYLLILLPLSSATSFFSLKQMQFFKSPLLLHI